MQHTKKTNRWMTWVLKETETAKFDLPGTRVQRAMPRPNVVKLVPQATAKIA